MDKKVMKKWVKALRSGEFKQGAGVLDARGEYCCLGVLCALALNEGVVGVLEWNPSGEEKSYHYGEEENDLVLPKEVLEWSGMKDSSGRIPFSNFPSLVTMNDALTDFKAIADHIETHWKIL